MRLVWSFFFSPLSRDKVKEPRHTFLIDVHKSFVIYEVNPQPRIQEPSSRGRKARRLITGQKSLRVEQFVESCSTEDWRVYNVRETTRGSLKLRVLRKSVYVWDNQSEQARRYELLVTENMDGQDRKYSLTNQKPSDLDAASKLDAEATLLGREVL